MPIYDYRCDHCGHVFSAVQSFKEEPLEKCPNCGKLPRRLLSTPAIVFKGSGWYKTDSRPADKAASDGTPSAETKTETKDAGAKADAKSGTTKSEKRSETKSSEKSTPKSDAAS